MTRAAERAVPMLIVGAAPGGRPDWVCASDAADALRRVRAAQPRAVLLRVDGVRGAAACVDLLEELRRRRPRVPLVVLSAGADERLERLVRAAGAHCYVHGAIDPARLEELVAGVAPGPAAPRTAPAPARPPEKRANAPPRLPT